MRARVCVCVRARVRERETERERELPLHAVASFLLSEAVRLHLCKSSLNIIHLQKRALAGRIATVLRKAKHSAATTAQHSGRVRRSGGARVWRYDLEPEDLRVVC